MNKALSCYDKDLEGIAQMEKSGVVLEVQEGGSWSSVTKFLYRIHTSRFKVLIRIVCCSLHERRLAEVEAINITSKHMYAPSSRLLENVETEMDVQHQIWHIFTNTVVCALEQRHARGVNLFELEDKSAAECLYNKNDDGDYVSRYV